MEGKEVYALPDEKLSEDGLVIRKQVKAITSDISAGILKKLGVDYEDIVKRLVDKLDAKTVKEFVTRGGAVVAGADRDDNYTQMAALREILNLIGAYPDKDDKQVENNIQVIWKG